MVRWAVKQLVESRSGAGNPKTSRAWARWSAAGTVAASRPTTTN